LPRPPLRSPEAPRFRPLLLSEPPAAGAGKLASGTAGPAAVAGAATPAGAPPVFCTLAGGGKPAAWAALGDARAAAGGALAAAAFAFAAFACSAGCGWAGGGAAGSGAASFTSAIKAASEGDASSCFSRSPLPHFKMRPSRVSWAINGRHSACVTVRSAHTLLMSETRWFSRGFYIFISILSTLLLFACLLSLRNCVTSMRQN